MANKNLEPTCMTCSRFLDCGRDRPEVPPVFWSPNRFDTCLHYDKVERERKD